LSYNHIYIVFGELGKGGMDGVIVLSPTIHFTSLPTYLYVTRLVGTAGGDTSEGDMFTTLDTNIKVIAWEEDRRMDKFGRERGRGT
jgi:hypothetical protein